MGDFQWLLRNTFTMVEGNFEFYCSEILQNEGFSMIVGEYFHHGWRKFWVLLLWNAPDWNISTDCWGILSHWLTKILSFTAPECYRIKNYFRVIPQKKGCCLGFLGFQGFMVAYTPCDKISTFKSIHLKWLLYPSRKAFSRFKVMIWGT